MKGVAPFRQHPDQPGLRDVLSPHDQNGLRPVSFPYLRAGGLPIDGASWPGLSLPRDRLSARRLGLLRHALDNWDVWRADFFAPAESLLAAAPWIFDRGNHEECARGGRGWVRALSPATFDPAQGTNGGLAAEPAFAADLGGVTRLDLDVASATEEVENFEQVDGYGRQFALAGNFRGPVWVAMHRPAFGQDAPAKMEKRGDNKTLAAALRANLSP